MADRAKIPETAWNAAKHIRVVEIITAVAMAAADGRTSVELSTDTTLALCTAAAELAVLREESAALRARLAVPEDAPMRERIARELEAEAKLIPNSDDADVVRVAADLVRAAGSYARADEIAEQRERDAAELNKLRVSLAEERKRGDAAEARTTTQAARTLLGMWREGAFENSADAAAQDVLDAVPAEERPDADKVIETWLRALSQEQPR